MPATALDLCQQSSFADRAKRSVPYLIKAVIVLAVLFLVSRTAPLMPAWGIALCWAILSAVSSIAFAYPFVINKIRRQFTLEKGGMLARLNEGRTVTLIAGFVLAAVCTAGLILEMPKWGALEWALAVLAVPLYLAVFALINRWLGKEYTPLFSSAKAILWTSTAVGVLLCIVYGIASFLLPAPDYASASEAFLATPQPFESSPSALMTEAGLLGSLADGLMAYGSSTAAHTSAVGYAVLRVVFVASAFFGISNLLTLCFLDPQELRRVFAPLNATDAHAKSTRMPVVKKFVATAAVLPVCLLALFLAADAKTAAVMQTEEYTAIEDAVRQQAGMAVYVLDGKYYDEQAAQALLAEMKQRSESLSAEARETLTPLINDSFDARLENVDGYLDWHYSLPADYERLVNMVTGTAEEFVADQFTAKIEEGVDDTELDRQLEGFLSQMESLESETKERLQEYEVSGVPEWLITTKDALDLSAPLEPTQKMLEASERFGLSAASGVGAGLVAKHLVNKAATKAFYSKVVSKISTTVGSRAIGATAGGAVGTVGGPLGTLVGIAAGTAVGVGVDYVLLNIDEAQNREAYKDEITATIEEERAAMLALVQ